MDVGVFPIDFQVDHRFRCTCTGRNVFVFKDTLEKWSRKEYHAFGIPFTQEYRHFAAQCLRWAFRAKREEHKNMMLQMADHWMQTAQKLERADTCVPSGARLASTPTPQDDARQKPLQDDFKGASR